MLARLAEDLYWSGRYLERLQHTARVLDVTTDVALASIVGEDEMMWSTALATLMLDGPYRERHDAIDPGEVAAFAVLDPKNPGSLVSLVRRLRENVRQVRELISSELWEAVNGLYLDFAARRPHELSDQPAQLYSFVQNGAHAIVGVAAETMSRDEASRFFELGIQLERTAAITRVLGTQASLREATGATGLESWAPVLRICSARDTFVRTGHVSDLRGVLRLLMFSAAFPRSIRFCVAAADDQVRMLRGDAERQAAATVPEREPLVSRRLGLLRSRLDFGDIEDVIARGLVTVASELETDLRDVHQAVAERFFHQVPGLELQVQEVRSAESWRGEVA